MGNEISQTSGQDEIHNTNVNHKRSQSLQRDLTLYHAQNASDTNILLTSNSRKSQSQISLHETFRIDENNHYRRSPKLTLDTSTTGIALLKTVQMELTDEEKERIQEVLARARLVEMKEGERVT
ncbi:hypothetical protein MN116_006372 [Schistosoma mekongi]|uniref:Uncharacterized protein n=1 Tax=Schistosoma mekongi TaxID=38744 RepID=A0AAE1ZCS9_SCHME|nr:hypothetical protein MN116_006372 [Schistosoma mekongi]